MKMVKIVDTVSVVTYWNTILYKMLDKFVAYINKSWHVFEYTIYEK